MRTLQMRSLGKALLLVSAALMAGMASAGERGKKSKPINIPTAETIPSVWRYTTKQPPSGWETVDFNDRQWQQGKSGFGTSCPGSKTNTRWNTPEIWLRREFQLPEAAPSDLKLRLHHDEDAEVYLNGVLALKVTGYVGQYETHNILPYALKALKAGKNVMAVHCRQTSGGQYIDVGLTNRSGGAVAKAGKPGNSGKGGDVYAKAESFSETFCAIRTKMQDGYNQDSARRAWASLEADFPYPCDWMQQDFGTEAWNLFSLGTHAEVLKALMPKALDELGAAGGALSKEYSGLASNGSTDLSKGLDLYIKACEARRAVRLKSLIEKCPKMVFVKHYIVGGSHYAYTEGQSDAQAERHFVPGSSLCLAEVSSSGIKVETLLDDPNGTIRDPDVSFDGKRILYAHKKSDREDDFHLYEMDVATRKIRQLTSGLGCADYEGSYLPDGDIVFNSTRCVQTVDCWWTEVSNLYRCNKDGKYMRRLTYDQVHDNFPTVTEDGRILYTRWEYNDRGQLYPQPLLQMNMDGTNQSDFYGGNSWYPTTINQARMIPGTQKVVAIETGHHSRQTGKLILVDPAKGRQEAQGIQYIAPVREAKAVKVDALGQRGELFMYPYPLSQTEFLVSYHPVGWDWKKYTGHLPRKLQRRGNIEPRLRLYFMTIDGKRELLAADSERPCNRAIPLRPRGTGGQKPSTVDYRKKEGTCYVQDVYVGPGLEGVKRGTIKTLRVVYLGYREAGVGRNGNGGPAGGALVSTPISIGNGAWDTKGIVGDATVKEDGSVFFKVPARMPIYFQLLDEKGRMVQSMRSWTTIQPGENASCVGCHEDKNSAPKLKGGPTIAMRAGAEALKPFYGPLRGFSFLKEVQPILNAKCVSCHDGTKGQDKSFSLKPTEVIDKQAKRKWTEAYLNLTQCRWDSKKGANGVRGNPDSPIVNWIHAQSAPPMLKPNSNGAVKSKMIDILEKGHYKVKMTKEEMDKLIAWIDLAVPFCADYMEANAWNDGEMAKFKKYADKRRKLEEMEQQNIQEFIRASANRK